MMNSESDKKINELKSSLDDFNARSENYIAQLMGLDFKNNLQENQLYKGMKIYLTILSEYITLFNKTLDFLEFKLDDADYNYLKESIQKAKMDKGLLPLLKVLRLKIQSDI